MSWTHRRYRVALRVRLLGSPNEAATGSSDNQVVDSIARIRDAVIGDDAALEGPFGPRRLVDAGLVDADYTASGRGLSFIEDYIRQWVLPLYANTHTEASATGLPTTALREDAGASFTARSTAARTTWCCSAALARRR